MQSTKEYTSGKQEIKRDVNISEARQAAIRLSLEFSISESNTVPHSGKEYDVQLYPADETYNILKRWEDVHDDYPEKIPFPEDKIMANDWYGVSEELQKIELETDPELMNKIIDDS